ALFLRHAREQGFDLGIRRMVAADGDALPTSLRDRIRRISNRAGKVLGGAGRLTAARDVDGRARFPKGQGDALADAATGPGDDGHSSAQQGHESLETQIRLLPFPPFAVFCYITSLSRARLVHYSLGMKDPQVGQARLPVLRDLLPCQGNTCLPEGRAR